jgi:hypothetical protein
MAGVVLQYLVAEQMRPLERCNTTIWSDNTPKPQNPKTPKPQNPDLYVSIDTQ